jgi:hypothetical protein
MQVDDPRAVTGTTALARINVGGNSSVEDDAAGRLLPVGSRAVGFHVVVRIVAL